MKKIFSFLLTVATTLAITTSCADIPMPYDIFANGDVSFGKKLPYKNASLSAFSTFDKKEGLPAWSIGANYTQATGYQKWDGAADKSNKEVESYLISPALNTTCASGKVRISFDQTIRYENNVTGWQNYHKVFISKDYTGNTADFDKATWTPLAYTPKASTTNDWTLYTSGQIALPEDFVNHDSVYVAFYFYAPAASSTTWELQNFLIEEGEATNNGSGDTPAPAALGSKEAPLTVAAAKAVTSGSGYVTGYIVGYIDGQKLAEGAKFEAASAAETELLLADAADCKDATLVLPVQLPVGDLRTKLNPNIAENIGKKVVLYGSFENYFGTMGMKSTSWAKIDGTEVGKDPDAPVVPIGEAKGDGTKENPFNVAAALNATKALGADKTSDKEYYIKGKISKINSTIATDVEKYGNVTFFISDDGTTNNEFEAYQVCGLGGAKITDANYIKVGDEVVLYGKVTYYKGNTCETTGKGAAYIYSLNGVTEGGNTTGGDDSGNTGTESEITLANANFEAWTDDATPEGWKSTNTASNATLAKSTDAHGGSFSVSVTAVEDKNMRLASKEIALKAGTYTFSYYAKGTKADKTQTRGGHAYPDGTSVKYTYNSSFTDLNNETWTLVSYEFTLSENTTINLVVMNPKKSSYVTSQDILVDDAKLTTKNGGLAE